MSATPKKPDASARHGDDPGVHVCSLLTVHDVLEATRARFLMSVINEHLMLATPHRLETRNHLKLACNDIAEPMPGLIAPDRQHVEDLIGFARRWNRQGPLVVHCWAGISRSSAAAFVTLCALNPDAPETAIAERMREVSRTAHPNRRIVGLADDVLGRGGSMVRAIAAIGDGEAPSGEARPFRLPSRYKS